ncbi:S24 family peptidase [Helicobacter muridarum]|uniref:S24 family peptidase n=2 Tax=Helicobacter muridarum TaxID=216 RepID=A0A377PVI8_9HELI|nr:S24 family peptidase [Helicobacter muridarum]STQ86587.1 Uncharacterised protein [Helicobacter muridarum]
MTHAIPPNCKLLVQSKTPLEKGMPREEQICVTRIDNELYIKRFQKRLKYKLISDNKSYNDIVLEGENYEIYCSRIISKVIMLNYLNIHNVCFPIFKLNTFKNRLNAI